MGIIEEAQVSAPEPLKPRLGCVVVVYRRNVLACRRLLQMNLRCAYGEYAARIRGVSLWRRRPPRGMVN